MPGPTDPADLQLRASYAGTTPARGRGFATPRGGSTTPGVGGVVRGDTPVVRGVAAVARPAGGPGLGPGNGAEAGASQVPEGSSLTDNLLDI